MSALQKAIRVTTFMQRLKNPEALMDSSAEVQGGEESQRISDEGDKGTSDGGVTSSSVSLEVTVDNSPVGMDHEEIGDKVKITTCIGPTVGISPSEIKEYPCQQSQSNKAPETAQEKKADEGTRKIAANFNQNKVFPENKQETMSDSCLGSNLDKKHASHFPDTSNKRKMAATLHATPSTVSAAGPAAVTVTPEKKPGIQKEKRDDNSENWCQTEVPEAVAERSVGASVTQATVVGEVRLRDDASPMVRRDREARKADRYSAEFSIPRTGPAPGQGCYSVGSTASLGRHATPYNPEGETVGLEMTSFGSPYSSLYATGTGIGMYGTGLPHTSGSSTTSDWQMDSVIEQIEKQMAAVLEKIEGDMPSLLEQISDCPPEPLRVVRSTHASPATSRAHPSTTPPPLPNSPRPAQPSLPRLTIPPPSYPPPSPPTQASSQVAADQADRDGLSGAAHTSQSPKPGMGRGL